MKKLILTLIALVCLFVFTGGSYAWDEGGWDTLKVPFIRKTAAPTVNDDDYGVPYLWVDETNDKMYLLIDNTAGAAVWQLLSYAGGSPSYTTVDLTGITDGNVPYMQAAGAGFGDSPVWRTDANTVTIKSTTGQAVTLAFSADAAEDNSDKWKLVFADGGNVTLQTYESGSWVTVATWTNAGGLTMTGAIAGATLNTGQGAYELYAMNQDVESTDAVTFDALTLTTKRPFPVTLTADDSYSGDVITVTYGETVVFGQLCYPDSTDNEWKLALATNAAVKHPAMGVALESKGNGESGLLLLRGTIRDATYFSGVAMGDIIYLSDGAAGNYVTAAPADSGDIVQVVGFAIAANYIYFNPDYTYVEVP